MNKVVFCIEKNGEERELYSVNLSDNAKFSLKVIPLLSKDEPEKEKSYETVNKPENLDIWKYERITKFLNDFMIPPNIKGYRFLRDAINMCVEDSFASDSMVKNIYGTVAKKNNTTPSRVERAIRHAIGHAFANNTPELISLFPKNKVPNSQFVTTIAEKISLDLKYLEV